MSVRWVPTGLPQVAIADRAPLVTDDRTAGARLFSRWLWEAEVREWVCIDDSVGAAVWVEIAGAADAQPISAILSAIAALVWSAGDQVPVFTAAATLVLRTIGAAAGGDLLDRDAGDARYQAINALLAALAGVTWTSGVEVPVLTAAATAALRRIGAAAGGDLLDRDAGDGRYRKLGSDLAFASIINGDSNLAVAASDAYGLIRVTSGTRTHTLPDIAANSLPVGWWVRWKNRSGNAVTVNRAGSDTVNAGGTSFSITNNTSLFAVVVSGSAWEST